MYCLVGPSCEESEGVRVGEGESVTAEEESMDITSQTKDEQLVRGRRKGGQGWEGEEMVLFMDSFPSLRSLTLVSVWEKQLPPGLGR